MANHHFIVSGALVAALSSAPVQAELTGIGLKEVCDSSELACISYVRGFIEGVGIRGLMLMGPENFFQYEQLKSSPLFLALLQSGLSC